MFFGVFLEKCCKQQLQGSRKLAQGAKSTVQAFVCRKNANVVPDNCKKSGKRFKRVPKNTSVNVCKSIKSWCTVVPRTELTYRTLTTTFLANSGSLILCAKLAILGIFRHSIVHCLKVFGVKLVRPWGTCVSSFSNNIMKITCGS